MQFDATAPKKIAAVENSSKIFIGHTPAIFCYGGQNRNPINRVGFWNLVTGASYPEGRVNIMIADTNELWESDFIKTLYHTLG